MSPLLVFLPNKGSIVLVLEKNKTAVYRLGWGGLPGVPPPFYVLPHRSSCSHATAARQPSSDLRWSRCGPAGAVPHGRAQLSRLRRLSQQTTPSTTVTQRGISQMTGRRGDTAQPSCSILRQGLQSSTRKVLPCPFSPRCCVAFVLGETTGRRLAVLQQVSPSALC